jgi:hypothetical protein
VRWMKWKRLWVFLEMLEHYKGFGQRLVHELSMRMEVLDLILHGYEYVE